MAALQHCHLFSLEIALHPTLELGTTPVGGRRVFPVAGGRFSGDRLRGEISPFAGSDILLLRMDGTREQDVRLILRTDDGADILMTYRGRGHSSTGARDRLSTAARTDSSHYYLRTAPFFETAAPAYAWLNAITSIGVGERRSDSCVQYEVYEIL